MPQIDREIDTIRERADAEAIDRKYAEVPDSYARFRQEYRDEVEREVRHAAEGVMRIDLAVCEVQDVNDCLSKGTLDYTAAAGVLIEYLPEILRGLSNLQGRIVKVRP